MGGTSWLEEGPSEYECTLEIEFLPGMDAITVPVKLTGDGIAPDEYAEICKRMQIMAQNAASDGLKEVGDLLNQLVGVCHYTTGGISSKEWATLSKKIASESLDHVVNFLRLRLEGAIAEATSWAVLRFDIMPTHADVVGSWIREKTGLEKVRRTRSARRRAKIQTAVEWGSLLAEVFKRVPLA